MELDIVRKLQTELVRGISTESQVVYVMVKIRKLLDLERDQITTPAYSMLRLCCNWAVHVELSRSDAQKVVKMADALYTRLLKGELSEQEKEEFRNVLNLNRLREELNQFLTDKHLQGFSEGQWNSFLDCFLRTIEDCPLVCRASNTSEVDEVVLIKELGEENRRPDGDPPQILWALCFQGHHKLTIGANFTLSDKVADALVDFGHCRNPQVTPPGS